APAWRFLEQADTVEELIGFQLRVACGFPIDNQSDEIIEYIETQRGGFYPLLGKSLETMPRGALSVKDITIPLDPFNLSPKEALGISDDLQLGEEWLGLYGEPRLVYTSPAFRQGPHKSSDRRTVHIAVDVFAKQGHEIYAPLDGWVETVENRDHHLDYGGVIILRHQTEQGYPFYTLYGHLNPEVTTLLSEGQFVKRGEAFCRLGGPNENGGWPPHVHFQLALTTRAMGKDWPGVSTPDDLALWTALCPNPAALLNLTDSQVAYQGLDQENLNQQRKAHFGENLKLSYQKPLTFLRGWRHHLFDEAGRPYLDAYNNVPHVGHAHPRIHAVAADQLKRINSNTRYLHPAQIDFAEKILSKCPKPLTVCYFVNSGSEANELSMRLARSHSGGKDMITPNHGYHGNTTGAIAISAYKFNKQGGIGQQDWVQLVDVADDYQGTFKRNDPNRAQSFADQVNTAIDNINDRGGKLAGFIAETFPSVGGQIIPPQGYLKAVYQKIRQAGGVCIADEVQTGLGRLGQYYFGFEQQAVVPDIVVLGKPIGNGHPIGVVITTEEIAQSFANGIEYFSTFGGSTLSCRIGKEVLDIVDEEKLSENAQIRGEQLLAGLSSLQNEHAIIGDIRGMGLFIGVELVTDRTSQAPATEVADYVLNRMRDHRILMGTEGPHDNILKIRPPLTIDTHDIDCLLENLNSVLSETFVSQNSTFGR
ncbi:MAG: 4-aminobutyrate aminotransferase-like enzyme, partial [Saprospiraceae bacterium]